MLEVIEVASTREGDCFGGCDWGVWGAVGVVRGHVIIRKLSDTQIF